jgi:hypothetical protein
LIAEYPHLLPYRDILKGAILKARTPLDPKHLFQQARKLIGPAPIPDPLQENLRRAASPFRLVLFIVSYGSDQPRKN